MTTPLFIAAAERALPLYTIAQLRAIEAAAARSLPPHTLMRRAGCAAAQFIEQRFTSGAAEEAQIWLAAGPGNNGGDALVTATELHQRGAMVKVWLPLAVKPADARLALDHARAAGVPITDQLPAGGLADCLCVVDGLFGIGLTRPLDGLLAELAARLARRAERGGVVLALDVPSGLNSDTGHPITGASGGEAVKATHTLTFIGAKPGLYTAHGRDHAGEVWLAPLGANAAFSPPERLALAGQTAWLNASALFAENIARRPHASHKGQFGNLAIIGGNLGMAGAPILAARAALFAGAGKIRVAFIDKHAPAYDPPYPELMLCAIDAFDSASINALVIGCGLGDDMRALRALESALDHAAPKVIDADGLNLIARNPRFAARLAEHSRNTVLTPHPLEAARLLQCDVQAVQRDRLAAARALAAKFACVAVLKGSGTVIAAPDGRLAVNPSGNAGLATAGAGDALSGFIGALIAQHMPLFEASLAAVFLHGRAAEEYTQQGAGPIGLSAGEIAPMFRRLLNRYSRQQRKNGKD